MARRNGQRRNDLDGIITALIYTRVSKDEQAKDGLSLPAQLQAARRYCAERGWIIGGEYQDVLSGKRDDRVGYQRLLADARRLASEGKAVAVVVMRLDRFGRKLTERIRSREEFKQIGVVTHSVREGGEVSDLMANMLAVMAQEEIERLGDRVRDTREHNIQNGWSTPGRPAWGYRLRPATEEERRQGAPKSVLVVDEVTAPHVEQAFQLVASGAMTPRALAVWVAGLPDEARGIVNRTVRVAGEDGEQEAVRVERARSLPPSAVRRMLSSAVYVGRFEADDDQHPGERGRWEPIIDQDTFDAVQRKLAATKGRTGPISGAHLLTRILRCGTCGGKMSGQTVQGRWKRYRCSAFVAGGEATRRDCKGSAGAKPIDDAVLERVTAILAPLAQNDPDLKRAMARTWERLRKPDDALAKDRARLVARARRDAEDARRRIGDAARLLVDQVIDRVAYEALVGAEQQRLEQAEQRLATPEATAPTVPTLPPLDRVLADLGDWQQILAGDVVAEQRAILALLVERVVPVRLAYGKYRAEITWTPRGRALGTVAQHVS